MKHLKCPCTSCTKYANVGVSQICIKFKHWKLEVSLLKKLL